MKKGTQALALAVCAGALAACASISVKPGMEGEAGQMPKRIYVEAFDVSRGNFRVDRDGRELREFKRGMQVIMSTAISTDLSNRLVSAWRWKRNSPPPPQNAWLIRGEFTRVAQGSRLLRGTVGFGLGGTKLETHVKVYDLSEGEPRLFLTFSTTGGSNAEPGAITAIATDPLTIVIEAVAGGFSGVAHGLTEDSRRTAREITAKLSDYMHKRGWITADKWVKPKQIRDHTEW